MLTIFEKQSMGQVPPPPPPPGLAPAAAPSPGPLLDISQLDRNRCESLMASPPRCSDGEAGAACRSINQTVAVKCPDILGRWTFPNIVPKQIQEAVANYTSLVLLALLGLGTTTVLTWIESKKAKAVTRKITENARISASESREKIDELEKRVLDPFFDRPYGFEQFATNMILIGEGGSGKTTLIHALSGADEAKPDMATAEMYTYSLVHEISIEYDGQIRRRLTRIYTDDYVGQDWVQGTQNDRVKTRQKFVKSSTVVIVVDLVRDGTKFAPAIRRDKQQPSRIRDQLKIYNEPAIQTISKLLGGKGQIVLFINKSDLIYPLTDERVSEAKEGYRPLINMLSELRGVKLHIIVGSAVTGYGVVGYDGGHDEQKSLLKIVTDHAEKIDINTLKATRDVKANASI